MPLTVLRSAINRPVRYSAKCRRSGSLANRSAYWTMRSCTTLGNSTIAGILPPVEYLPQSRMRLIVLRDDLAIKLQNYSQILEASQEQPYLSICLQLAP